MPEKCGTKLYASKFQSAPDREVGRCCILHSRSSLSARFNPRPTVRSGDAESIAHLLDGIDVSIRARP